MERGRVRGRAPVEIEAPDQNLKYATALAQPSAKPEKVQKITVK